MPMHYIRPMDASQCVIVWAALDRLSCFSERDQCRVTHLRCAYCGKEIMVELDAAKEKVARRSQILCLGCDPDAEEPAFTAITEKARSLFDGSF